MPASERAEVRTQTERWFVRRGVPHLIEGYSAQSDIWTRARPALLLIFISNMIGLSLFDKRLPLAVAPIAVLVVFLVALAIFNRWRGRSRFAVPSEVSWPELAFVVLLPTALALALGASLGEAAYDLIQTLVTLGVVYIIVSYGLLPMAWWATRIVFRHLRVLAKLVARTLPVLLILTVFMFINAEIWQVAEAVPPPGFAIVSLALVLIGLLFLWLSTSQMLASVEATTTVEDATGPACNSPIAPFYQQRSIADAELAVRPLGRGGRINTRIVMVASLSVQVVLVSALVTLFYLFLGLLLITPEVLTAWTGHSGHANLLTVQGAGGNSFFLTIEHVRVSGLVGVLGGLNIAVSLVSDEPFGEAFTADLKREIRENLAVQRLYQEL